MRRQNILAVTWLFLILLLPSAVAGQTDSWEKAFDSVPESLRGHLVERFRLMAEYERTQQWEQFYDLLVEGRVQSKESFVEERRKASAGQQLNWLVEFVPTNVDKEHLDVAKADYRITGYAKVRERGCIVKRGGVVYAFLKGGEWHFSGYLIELTPSHSQPPPCISENE